MNYTLNEKGEPVHEPNLRKWARWFENIKNRQIAYEDFPDGTYVSTVFLGIDHSLDNSMVLWETMIFGGPHDQYCERYTSRADALAGHAKAVSLATDAEGGKHK